MTHGPVPNRFRHRFFCSQAVPRGAHAFGRLRETGPPSRGRYAALETRSLAVSVDEIYG